MVADKIQYGVCKVEWECDERGSAFLDMWIHVDPERLEVDWRPFRKAHNHTERVPWASYHPKDVKRGVFFGEMSRLAILCKKPRTYLDALHSLGCLYVERGYPAELINRWLRENTAKRWERRFSTPEPGPQHGVLALKTTFNPAWDGFNVKELKDIVTGAWIQGHLLHKWVVTSDGILDPTSGERTMPSRPTGRKGFAIDAPDSKLSAPPGSEFGLRGVVVPSGAMPVAPEDPRWSKDPAMPPAGSSLDLVGSLDAVDSALDRPVSVQTFYGRAHIRRPLGEEGAPSASTSSVEVVSGPSGVGGRVWQVLPSGGLLDVTPGGSASVEPPQPSGLEQVRRADRVLDHLEPRTSAVSPAWLPSGDHGTARGFVTTDSFDISKSDLLEREWLISRKRTTNLGDLAVMWRSSVLRAHWGNRDRTDLFQELDMAGEAPQGDTL